MAQLRVGVIGAGQMGAHHIETIEKLESAQLIAVADPAEGRARAAIGRRPVEWTARWEAVLERDDIDAVSIAAASEYHAEITLAALEAGIYVLVEKPIATTVSDALRMDKAARATGRKL